MVRCRTKVKVQQHESIIKMGSCETDSNSSDKSFPRQLLSPPCVDVPQLKPSGDVQKTDLCICVGLQWKGDEDGLVLLYLYEQVGDKCHAATVSGVGSFTFSLTDDDLSHYLYGYLLCACKRGTSVAYINPTLQLQVRMEVEKQKKDGRLSGHIPVNGARRIQLSTSGSANLIYLIDLIS